jgi:hypothetical protein
MAANESNSELLLKSTRVSNLAPESIEMKVIFLRNLRRKPQDERDADESDEAKGTRWNFTRLFPFPPDPHGDKRVHPLSVSS